jgi:hypothetical protein
MSPQSVRRLFTHKLAGNIQSGPSPCRAYEHRSQRFLKHRMDSETTRKSQTRTYVHVDIYNLFENIKLSNTALTRIGDELGLCKRASNRVKASMNTRKYGTINFALYAG